NPKMDVTSIGDINLDAITSKLKELPEKDSQRVVSDLSLSSGGCAANFAKAISKLGLETRFIGKMGDDVIGEFLRNSMEGVDLVLSKGSKSGITFAMVFEDDTRSFVTYPGSNGEFTIGDINLDLIEGKYLHVGSFFLQGLREDTKKVLDHAHGRGMSTSFDTGWDPAGWCKEDITLVREILKGVDIFFPNLKEGEAITGAKGREKVCEELLALGPQIIALKLGSEGSYIANGKERISIPPTKVDVVDTTGAGDVFDASFVYGHSKGWDLEKVGKFANAAAALSTRDYGSNGYPAPDDVNSILQ
ncbi:MAG: carbohydrate kinase family protein, partial [Candidatus Altiarchaeota archaeon]|nr:carbohydrate kinase family protein [Candidatus Altiarchaeota archaeon]